MRNAINQKVQPAKNWPMTLCEHRVEMLLKWQGEIRYFMQQFQPGRSIIASHF